MPPSSPVVVFSAPRPPAPPPSTNTDDNTVYDYTAYLAELRQRPVLAPQLLFALVNIAGNTVRAGRAQNQAGDAPEQRGVAPHDASWISWITIAALVRVCSDQIAGDAGRCGRRRDGRTAHRGQSMNRRVRRAWRTVLPLFAAVVGAVLGPGVAQAAPLEGAAVLREAAVFANLDSLSPPIVTTLEPDRDVAHPACRRDETDMVFIRWAPRQTLPGPQDIGWTYADALDLHAAPPPC